jgi:hypothetical protein
MYLVIASSNMQQSGMLDRLREVVTGANAST